MALSENQVKNNVAVYLWLKNEMTQPTWAELEAYATKVVAYQPVLAKYKKFIQEFENATGSYLSSKGIISADGLLSADIAYLSTALESVPKDSSLNSLNLMLGSVYKGNGSRYKALITCLKAEAEADKHLADYEDMKARYEESVRRGAPDAALMNAMNGLFGKIKDNYSAIAALGQIWTEDFKLDVIDGLGEIAKTHKGVSKLHERMTGLEGTADETLRESSKTHKGVTRLHARMTGMEEILANGLTEAQKTHRGVTRLNKVAYQMDLRLAEHYQSIMSRFDQFCDINGVNLQMITLEIDGRTQNLQEVIQNISNNYKTVNNIGADMGYVKGKIDDIDERTKRIEQMLESFINNTAFTFRKFTTRVLPWVLTGVLLLSTLAAGHFHGKDNAVATGPVDGSDTAIVLFEKYLSLDKRYDTALFEALKGDHKIDAAEAENINKIAKQINEFVDKNPGISGQFVKVQASDDIMLQIDACVQKGDLTPEEATKLKQQVAVYTAYNESLNSYSDYMDEAVVDGKIDEAERARLKELAAPVQKAVEDGKAVDINDLKSADEHFDVVFALADRIVDLNKIIEGYENGQPGISKEMYDKAIEERDAAIAEQIRIQGEFDRYKSEYTITQEQYDNAVGALNQKISELEAIIKKYEAQGPSSGITQAQYDKAIAERNEARAERDSISKEYQEYKKTYIYTQADMDGVRNDLDAAKKQFEAYKKTHTVTDATYNQALAKIAELEALLKQYEGSVRPEDVAKYQKAYDQATILCDALFGDGAGYSEERMNYVLNQLGVNVQQNPGNPSDNIYGRN